MRHLFGIVRHLFGDCQASFWACQATCLGYYAFLFRLQKELKRGEGVGFKVFKGMLLLSTLYCQYVLYSDHVNNHLLWFYLLIQTKIGSLIFFQRLHLVPKLSPTHGRLEARTMGHWYKYWDSWYDKCLPDNMHK